MTNFFSLLDWASYKVYFTAIVPLKLTSIIPFVECTLKAQTCKNIQTEKGLRCLYGKGLTLCNQSSTCTKNKS